MQQQRLCSKYRPYVSHTKNSVQLSRYLAVFRKPKQLWGGMASAEREPIMAKARLLWSPVLNSISGSGHKTELGWRGHPWPPYFAHCTGMYPTICPKLTLPCGMFNTTVIAKEIKTAKLTSSLLTLTYSDISLTHSILITGNQADVPMVLSLDQTSLFRFFRDSNGRSRTKNSDAAMRFVRTTISYENLIVAVSGRYVAGGRMATDDERTPLFY